VSPEAKANLAERRRRQRAHSNWDMMNAVREILGLDPIAENNGKRGKRKEQNP